MANNLGKSGVHWLTKLIIIIGVISLTYFFLINPSTPSGNPLKPFASTNILLSEKLSYLLKSPKEGDSVIFKTPNQSIYFGIIIALENGKTYLVMSNENAKNLWKIDRPQIVAKIYYPSVSQDELLRIHNEGLRLYAITQ